MGKQILNGVVYGTSEIVKLTPYIYSFEEREIGVWTNSKPLYQKTVLLTIPNQTGHYEFSVSTPNLEDVAHTEYSLYVNNYYQGEISASNNVETLMYTGMSNSVVEFYFVDNTLAGNTLQFTAQYTKTTDLPGSGKWTTAGTTAVHYNDNEKVIGTWFNEPLYTRTEYIQLSTPLDGTTTVSVPLSYFSSAEKFFNISVIGSYTPDQQTYYIPFHEQSANNADSAALIVYWDKSTISVYTGAWYKLHPSADNRIKELYVTIQYTKST